MWAMLVSKTMETMNVFNSLVSHWPPHPPPRILFSHKVQWACGWITESNCTIQVDTDMDMGGGMMSCLIVTFCAQSSSRISNMLCLKSNEPKLYICYIWKKKTDFVRVKNSSVVERDWITANIKQYDATKQTCWRCQGDGSTGQGRSGSFENYTVDVM